MPGESVQIGPFIGGLNTKSDPTAINDRELVVCENFELDSTDGSLVSRPPIKNEGVPFPLGASGNVIKLGYFYSTSGTAYLIASDGLSSTYYYSGSAWTLITNTFAASALAQFDDKAWLLAPVGAANPGGYWSPSGGFTAEANMPKGSVIVAMKSRLWVAAGEDAVSNGTRLYFSKVLGQTPFWQVAPDFIQINAGDGQNIIQMKTYYQSLLIFRTDSIYTFQFTTDPTNGTVSLTIPGVGLASRDAVVGYENYFYFMHRDRAYEFLNNRVRQINEKVPLKATSKTGIYRPYTVGLFNQRVIFTYWDTTYVYSLRTQTWCTWKSTVFGPLGLVTELRQNGDLVEAILFSALSVPTGGTRTAPTLRISDGVTAVAETMKCTIQTKNYDYEEAARYKRLFWWGADAVYRSLLKASAVPITASRTVTWGEMLTTTWGNALNYTWAMPSTSTVAIETTRNPGGGTVSRKFSRFLKGLRFRQIYFKLVFDTDGSTQSAPVRVFQLRTYVLVKPTVSKAIS